MAAQDARAKPLNALTRAALATGVTAWDDEIEYLESAISDNRVGTNVLHTMQSKLADLKRSREWLQSKLASVES